MAYQSNSSSLEDQGCSSMDSLENQAPPSDSVENQSLPCKSSSKSSLGDDCSTCDSSEGRNTPTNSLQKRQSSSKTDESDSEVLGLDLVRTEQHSSKVGVERNRNQVFVPERDILFPYFKFRFRLSRYRISGRKKAGKFVIL